ncbi:hypothetical protein [Cricetibacter osteomyelitidis]
MLRNKITLFCMMLLAFPTLATIQTATVKGSVINQSSSGGKASINVASAVGRSVGSNNDQTAIVNGSLINSASGGGKAAINIGSSVNYGGTVKQTVSVGSIVNSSSGGKSEVNIGSVVKD